MPARADAVVVIAGRLGAVAVEVDTDRAASAAAWQGPHGDTAGGQPARRARCSAGTATALSDQRLDRPGDDPKRASARAKGPTRSTETPGTARA